MDIIFLFIKWLVIFLIAASIIKIIDHIRKAK
nr:MAG TPA: hypothetical protein [Caudoviricetes sp.]